MPTTEEIVDVKVRKFLATRRLIKGSPLTDDEITSIVSELGRKPDILNKDSLKGYKEFLLRYGCIFGVTFCTIGLAVNDTNKENKIRYVVSVQRNFENRCKIAGINDDEIKSCWLIAQMDQGDDFYVNVSKNGKGYIYAINFDLISKFFARTFFEFLDKFYAEFEANYLTYRESVRTAGSSDSE